MAFVKANNFYINIDHNISVEDTGMELVVSFRDAKGKPVEQKFNKSDTLASRLLQALEIRT